MVNAGQKRNKAAWEDDEGSEFRAGPEKETLTVRITLRGERGS